MYQQTNRCNKRGNHKHTQQYLYTSLRRCGFSTAIQLTKCTQQRKNSRKNYLKKLNKGSNCVITNSTCWNNMQYGMNPRREDVPLNSNLTFKQTSLITAAAKETNRLFP